MSNGEIDDDGCYNGWEWCNYGKNSDNSYGHDNYQNSDDSYDNDRY